MASLIKHKSGIYYIEFYYHGKRIWRTLKTRDKREAIKKFQEYEQSVPLPHLSRKDVKPDDLPTEAGDSLQHAIDEFKGYVKVNCSNSTQKDYKSILKLLSEYFGGNKPVTEVTVRDIERYKIVKYTDKISPHTVNHNLRGIKSFFNKLVQWGMIEINPCKGVKLIRIDETIRPYLSKEDPQAVLKRTTGTQLHDIILFAVLTGLRLGEIVNLTWDDILLEKRKIIVRSNGSFHTKSGKMRVIPISSTVSFQSLPDRRGVENKR